MRHAIAAALPLFANAWPRSVPDTSRQEIRVLEYNALTAYAKFSIPCPGCFDHIARADRADESLVFDFQVNPTYTIYSSDIVVNYQTLDIKWDEDSSITQSSQLVPLLDDPTGSHKLSLTWTWSIGSPPASLSKEGWSTQNIHFRVSPADVDDPSLSVGFMAVMSPTSSYRLVGLIPDSPSAPLINFQQDGDSCSYEGWTPECNDAGSDASSETNDFDIEGELESLALLEAHAQSLQVEIAARKQAIALTLKQERDKLCLKHLIRECDGIVCKATAIAERICNKVGINTAPAFRYPPVKSAQAQPMIALATSEKQGMQQQPAYGEMKSRPAYSLKTVELIKTSNPATKVLTIIASLLGLTAIIAFIKRRCMSVRTRRERAADREERRNARAYRRAARRALMRKRWDSFVDAINCFKGKTETRTEDYEEKRALILQDAFLEQDLDQAEKGEIMEAEIRELRYAHEIVSSLVRVDEHRYDLVTPINDPPPPLVPLPYTPDSRSRANSSYTLPSYTSESLPDYTSRPGDTDSSSSLVEAIPPSSTGETEVRDTPMSPLSEGSRATRYTPTSSVRATSPRPSEETLRTRPSRDTQR